MCIKHFNKELVIFADDVTKYPRKYLKLSDDSYPIMFPNCPSYLIKATCIRNVTIERKKKMERFDEDILNNFLIMMKSIHIHIF